MQPRHQCSKLLCGVPSIYAGLEKLRSLVQAECAAVLRSYATILVPSLLTAPRYFRGEVEFGVISQVRLPAAHAWGVPLALNIRIGHRRCSLC